MYIECTCRGGNKNCYKCGGSGITNKWATDETLQNKFIKAKISKLAAVYQPTKKELIEIKRDDLNRKSTQLALNKLEVHQFESSELRARLLKAAQPKYIWIAAREIEVMQIKARQIESNRILSMIREAEQLEAKLLEEQKEASQRDCNRSGINKHKTARIEPLQIIASRPKASHIKAMQSKVGNNETKLTQEEYLKARQLIAPKNESKLEESQRMERIKLYELVMKIMRESNG